jgi:hypothetical protein
MPVTKSRNGMQDFSALDQTDTTGFLFRGEDEEHSSDFKAILQMTATDDNFPVLLNKFPHKVSCLECFQGNK